MLNPPGPVSAPFVSSTSTRLIGGEPMKRAQNSVAGRVVSEEALGDEVIYVVETGGVDLRVRMPPTARFGPEAPVGVRHAGGRPPVYDPQTEKVVA